MKCQINGSADDQSLRNYLNGAGSIKQIPILDFLLT